MKKTPKEIYREYKENGCGDFAEWLGISTPSIRCTHNGYFVMYKMCRTRYSSNMIYGDPAKTKKAAKESYKKALNFHLHQTRLLMMDKNNG